jgi:hypothetical protein
MPYSIIKLNPKTYQVVEKDSNKIAYLINKRNKTCFSVINTDSGKVHSNCTSLQNAKAQLRLLYGLEKGSLEKRPSKMGKGEVETPMEEYENYEEYGDYGDGLYISTRTPVQHLRVSKIEGEGLFAAGTGGEASVGGSRGDTVPPKETWKTFFTRHAKGKKFASAEDSRVFMRKVGELWRNHKNSKKMSKAVEADAKKSMKLKLKKQLKSMKE